VSELLLVQRSVPQPGHKCASTATSVGIQPLLLLLLSAI
jgi:hypothetical protein